MDGASELSLLDVASRVFLHPAARGGVAHRAVVISYATDAALTEAGYRPCLALDVRALVTQSDVVRALHDASASLGALRSARLADLPLGAAPVACIPSSTTALAAFHEMAARGLSALGIVSPHGGCLVGNVSASDLRGLEAHQYDRLAAPVWRYLAERGARSMVLVALHERATFGALLDRMAFSRVHHVYIVNGAQHARLRFVLHGAAAAELPALAQMMASLCGW